MKVRVVSVSQRTPSWVSAACDDYAKRLPREWSFQSLELRSEPRERGRTVTQMLASEATRIAAACSGHRVVALDERGDAFTTAQFAAQLSRWQSAGDDVAFVIGSADGLAPSVKASAAMTMALSALTLPHALARIILIEQLYRAHSLLAGHPYHRS
jgi:23S rRNA (pseudouridine1915-N3)-methyltransferase